MADTQQLRLPPLREALEIMKRFDKPVKMSSFQYVRGLFELVPPLEDGKPTVFTRQRHQLEGNDAIVQTEYQSTSPPLVGEPAGKLAVRVELAIVIAYQFPDNTPDVSRVVFSKVQGISHSWPYWRTFLYNSTVQLGAIAQIAPLLPAEQSALMAGFTDDQPSERG